MYSMMQVHPLTLMIIMSAMMVTPLFALATYAFSGASLKKGATIASVFLIWGGFMTWICLAAIPQSLGIPVTLIVPICWMAPTLILFRYQAWFLDKPLSQRLLVSLQLWRVVGALFLLEMARGNIPGIFAYPAGIGDVIVAAVAAWVLLKYKNAKTIPPQAVKLVIFCGVVDFFSAFLYLLVS